MTYNCTNSTDNQKTFNDGYHIQVTACTPTHPLTNVAMHFVTDVVCITNCGL